jgi:small subunit ribosomal protein S21
MSSFRERKQFTKPSILKRKQMQKAQYVQAMRTAEEKG